MRIELEYLIDDLTREWYVFWFDDSMKTLWLDGYELQTKETKRHKYKTVKQYKRLSGRHELNNVPMNEVPLNDKIKNDAIAKFVSEIKVDYWFRD
ncbi:hypothetical protein D3C87_624300 [compost metagenome]